MSSDGENEGGGKSAGGHIAVAIGMLGALIARGADDCGRLALKGGAALGDDAARGASRVGSLADDGLRGGSKVGSLADDGMRAGKFAPVTEDGLRAGKVGPVAEPPPGSLIEETAGAAKAESHTGDIIEHGVDISLEVIPDTSTEDEVGEDDASPTGETGPVDSVEMRVDPVAILQRRKVLWKPALLPLMPASPGAFAAVFGRPEKPGDKKSFSALEKSPRTLSSSLEEIDWITHNPVTFVFYAGDAEVKKDPIALVMPNGDATTDSAIHRTCIRHSAHCVLLICPGSSAAAKVPCAKAAVDTWQSVTAKADNTPLQSFLANLVSTRGSRIALEPLVISRVDVSTGKPRIVRSRWAAKGSEPVKTRQE